MRHVNVTHVTNIYVTNVHYVNQNQGSVTVVTRDVFVGARPVRNAHMVVGADEISRGRVFGYTANIAPERSSVIVRTQGNIAAPPARYQTRAVVVRQAPPPPPGSPLRPAARPCKPTPDVPWTAVPSNRCARVTIPARPCTGRRRPYRDVP